MSPAARSGAPRSGAARSGAARSGAAKPAAAKPGAAKVRSAFLDIDGTLTTSTSMLRFWEYRLAARGLPPSVYGEERRRMGAFAAAGISRAEGNRSHAATYRGLSAASLRNVADEWFAAELRQGGYLNEHVVREIARHHDSGDLVVLVSGSPRVCLEPIARHVGAHHLLCSELEILDGVYTGALPRPMIGETKAAAVRDLAAEAGIDLAASTGYGDHESDLPMLRLTGRAAVVGEDPLMLGWARDTGSRVLPAAASPGKLPVPPSPRTPTERPPKAPAR